MWSCRSTGHFGGGKRLHTISSILSHPLLKLSTRVLMISLTQQNGESPNLVCIVCVEVLRPSQPSGVMSNLNQTLSEKEFNPHHSASLQNPVMDFNLEQEMCLLNTLPQNISLYVPTTRGPRATVRSPE